ncbi:hypothetical protein J3Q64DRAFT_1729365 [Phycomyces blakesleeanus]|uniref:Secreted peptide n=1 Tax=Phycomyces blakesleeanus TaxID=4837 RepID=A0ABR3B5I8_PHYBL
MMIGTTAAAAAAAVVVAVAVEVAAAAGLTLTLMLAAGLAAVFHLRPNRISHPLFWASHFVSMSTGDQLLGRLFSYHSTRQ